MNCKNCGKNIPDDANVCPYCATQQVSAYNPDLQGSFGGNQNSIESVQADSHHAARKHANRPKKGCGIAAWILTSLYILYVALSITYLVSMADSEDVGRALLAIIMFPLTIAATPLGAVFMSAFNLLYIVLAFLQLGKIKQSSRSFCIATAIGITIINVLGIAYNIAAVCWLKSITEAAFLPVLV